MKREKYFHLFLLLLPFLFFLSAEIFLRVARYPLFSVTERGRRLLEFQRNRSHPKDLETTCAPETTSSAFKKVFVFGESIVEGSNVGKAGRFSTLLQNELNKNFKDQYRVKNFGKAGIDSSFIESCIERVLKDEPRYLVIYAGHNDYVNFFNPRALPLVVRRSPFITDLLFYLEEHSRIYSGLSSILRGHDLQEPYPFKDLAAYQVRHEFVIKQYLARLERVYNLSKKANSHVILFTLPSNLKEFRTAERPYQESLFQDLYQKSLSFMKEGDTAYQLEKWPDSLHLYKLAKDWDPVPSRVTEAFNESLRQFAMGKKHLTLIDFAKLTDEKFEGGVGCTLFGDATHCDQFHLNQSGHTQVAELIYQVVAKK